MKIESRLKRIEENLGMDSHIEPMLLIVGRRGSREFDEAELDRRVEGAIRQHPNAPFILLLG